MPATDDNRAGAGRRTTGQEAADLASQVAGISWYHSIDLGHGIVTPGNPPDGRMLASGLPELRGKTVLDIGAWDGFWSFLAESRGAARVVAMDHYAWSVDFAARLEYWERCESEGVIPDHRLDFTEFWRPETMPGRAGFDLAHRVTGSSVEPVHADFMKVDPGQVGRFDVVLFLGVLYHVREPLSALERVCGLTSEVAVIETEAIAVLGMPEARLIEFHESGGLRGDYTNWFVPTEMALHALCKAAGFARVVTRIGPPPRSRLLKSGVRRLTGRGAGRGSPQPRSLTSSGDPIPDRGARLSREELSFRASQSPPPTSSAAAEPAASTTSARVCASWAMPGNSASYGEGGSATPLSSMAAKKRA